MKKDLTARYSYHTRYISDTGKLLKSILNKTVIPHQVEIQPGPTSGNICWLKCPYCYGLSAEDTKERLDDKRYIEILEQIAKGGVTKLIFAGYATDPLNYKKIENLIDVPIKHKQIVGFHTKAIKLSDRLASQITNPSVCDESYFSVSLDAGSNETYNIVHGVSGSKAKLYDKVLSNLARLVDLRNRNKSNLDISVTYLINRLNSEEKEIEKSIVDLKNIGVDLIRFTFPQIPRGYSPNENDLNIPDRKFVRDHHLGLKDKIQSFSDERCNVLIMDLDERYQTYARPRTLPCFARFIFPSIGFDGYLSHCSESAAPHFRKLALGNLNTHDFWDLFYNYDVDHFSNHLNERATVMDDLGCKCDRKEHVVNDTVARSNIIASTF